MRVFTIKEGIPSAIYGFESSQLARQSIMQELGIEHQLVITNLKNIVPNFVEQLEQLGFHNFYHAIFDLSDLARVRPSVSRDFLTSLEQVKKVEYTKEGYVGLVYYEDGTIECYTSQLFYRMNMFSNTFTLYGTKGIILEGDFSENYHDYHFVATGEHYSQWQLVSVYLAEHSNPQDKFMIDMINEYPLQLRKFFQNTKRELLAFTHYDILAPFMKFVLQNWCTNIVASPVLEKRLGSDVVRFLPPVYVEEVIEKTYETVTDWCIVGNMTIIKNCELAIEAFRLVPQSRLTIYGTLPDGMTKEQLPENVTYAGFVNSVPYENHQGYLSCSYSECFANSAVEASASGLVCLLSHTDLAHIYYEKVCRHTNTFRSLDELVKLLKSYHEKSHYQSSSFAEEYRKEKVKSLYEEVLNKKKRGME